MSDKPRGIEILALMYFLQGAFGILFLFVVIFSADLIMVIYSLIAIISFISIAYGLTTGRIWAWYGALILSIIIVIGGTIGIIFFKQNFQNIIRIILMLIIIYYLLRSNVKEYFFSKRNY